MTQKSSSAMVVQPLDGVVILSLEVLLSQLLSLEQPVAIRVESASKLAELNDPQAMHALLEVLNTDAEPRLVMHVIGLLARKKVYSAVIPLVDLVLCTGASGIEKVTPNFAKSDVGMRIRIAAAQALGRMGDDRAIMPLISLLGNQGENYRLRLAVAESLGRLGDTQALNPLINIVNDEHEPSQYLKESAVKALGMLGDIRAIEPLLNIFEAKKGFKDKFNFLKEQIIEAIGRLGSRQDKNVLVTLLEALKDESSSIRLSAVESLADIGDQECIPLVRERLFDQDDDVAIAAISTLYKLGGESLIREILAEQENLPQFIREELESYVP